MVSGRVRRGLIPFVLSARSERHRADLDSLTVVTRVNGEERQRGVASDMAFRFPMLLAYISTIMTLEPGDLVATGTPAGVGRLSPGDVVEVEVIGLSRITNTVAAG